MPTFSPNKAYPLPVVGADNNNWGNLQDQAFGIVDKNLGGELVKAVGGNTDVTLDTTEAQNLAYVLTGVLTGSINVIWPGSKGFFLVANSTTGAFTLSVKSSGGGIFQSIPQGGFAIIFSDGTNCFSVPTGTTMSLASLTAGSVVCSALSAVNAVLSGSLVASGGGSFAGHFQALGGATLGGPLVLGAAEIAATGTDQGSAAQIISTAAFISSGSGGVKLPSPAPGLTIIVGSLLGPSCRLYPNSGGILVGQGGQFGMNVPLLLAGSTMVSCYARNSTTWMYN